MLTKNEVTSLNLSPIKKDFVQIWNELLEVAGKLSERWDPTSTNESDPGIVILKALTGIADKLNYSIDKNILEAFMPTAAQEDSMRKLCDMLGYSMKYHQSATTTVNIKYYNSDPSNDEAAAMAAGLYIPKFTVITNSDQDINYFTTDAVASTGYLISSASPTVTNIPCMEGQIVKCESINDNNVITANQISDNNRFYLPETQIAENGIFIYNITNEGTDSLVDGEKWTKVNNLNVQARGSKVFKFGYDSYESRPYIEFPEDYSELFNDGIFVYYTRTNGVNGNVSTRTLTQLELPSGAGWDKVSTESFSVENVFAATTGANAENIKQAYNNFKKTIGTFETLVTCRDYMNKIYSLINDSTGKPLVSNILVTDIRNDINRAVTICSCDEAGILYKETPLPVGTKPVGESSINTSDPKYTSETGFSLVGKEEDYSYEQVGDPAESDYKLVGREEDYLYEQVGEPIESEYKLVGREEDYLYEQVGEPIESVPELLNTETSDPVKVSEDTVTSDVISEANKPVFGNEVEVQYGTTSSSVSRSTSWHLGASNGLPLFADDYGSFLESYRNFEVNQTGEAVSVNSNGTPSTVWYIKQGGTFFKTILPITKVQSTTTTIVNEKTETVTNQVTKTIREQRTLKEQNTKTIREQRTLKEQNTKTIKEQRTLKEQNTKTYTVTETITNEVNNEYAIDHFDLVFYPFKSYSQIKNNVKDIRTVYDASFDCVSADSIVNELTADGSSMISHNFKTPIKNDIVSINNYLRLTATIATNSKVTAEEGAFIIDNIKIALANAFNMRELDFGEEIPFDSIVEVIEKADPRIRVASLNEPALYTTFSVVDRVVNKVPKLVEYAVASDWMDLALADTTGRLTKVVSVKDSDGNIVDKTVSTFNTKEAKQIYNKLVVRNILAGRVPLFNYNSIFKSSFYEGPYQITEAATSKGKPADWPSEVPTATAADPYTIWTENDVIYTEQFDTVTEETCYTKTSTPEEYKDNLIAEDKSEDGSGVDNYITDISASCKLLTDEFNTITDVTLVEGEFVKLRAPNFTTRKTYPAYVNYYLDLAEGAISTSAAAAKATSLFNVLNSDAESWSKENTNVRWQKVLDYFDVLDKASGNTENTYKKTFKVEQLVSVNKTEDNNIDIQTGNLSTTISVGVNNTPIETSEYTVESLMALSGCVKLTNKDFIADVEWTPQEGESSAPTDPVPLQLKLVDFDNPFITNINVLSEVKTKIDDALAAYKTTLFSTDTYKHFNHSFTISLSFECVPFEAKSLVEWERFLRLCAKNYNNDTFKYQVLDFKPVDEHGTTILWRTFGEGYEVGKYITEKTEKLLKFDKNYFNTLHDIYLTDIYLAESLGADAKPVVIKNSEEYKLRKGEHLYIEYTPAATTDESSSQASATVTEVYGEGTIIRPSGFEAGIIDSAVLAKNGNGSHKTVTFTKDDGNLVQIAMQRLSANEQVEIRDFAQVELSEDFLKDTSAIYVYKNFNGCPALEEVRGGKRTYTLKDGEYIFYTDQNKSEFAYFTSGTQVTLEGNISIPEFDIIELSVIFDSGLQEIPWAYCPLASGARIIFQEYQYITLGAGDSIKSAVFVDTSKDATDETKKYLGNEWQYCCDAVYTLSNDPDNSITLPAINLHEESHGNGWEACSTLELDVTSKNSQTLRSTDKVETSLTLSRTAASGGSGGKTVIEPKQSNTAGSTKQALSFKTNLACQACGDNISIADVYYNPNNLKGFQLKVFSADEPVIVKTAPAKVVPQVSANVPDISAWTGEPLGAKDYLELWSSVNLEQITPASDCERALRLPVNLLPDTYGLFCIYVHDTNTSSSTTSTKVWIEAIPGTKANDITLLNTDAATAEYLDAGKTKLKRLYLNNGINCIRVNKSGRIFIKASAASSGVLYFDELRLVNSQVIKYTDAKQHTIALTTQGLNLEQLGYLDTTSDADSSKLDDATKAKLRTTYVDQTYADLSAIKREAETKFFAGYNELNTVLTKVKTLVDAESSIKADLEAIRDVESEQLSELVDKYNTVSATLKNEQSLLKALNNNTKADDLELKLVQLLESLSSVETEQQQLLEELAVLKAAAEANSEKLSDEEIMTDFTGSDITSQNIVFSEVAAIVTDKIEEQYQEQLLAIAEELNKTVNSESKNTLLTILNRLQSESTAPMRAELVSKTNELSSLVNIDIDELLEEITYAAADADYVTLLAALTQLRNMVDSSNVQVLVAEIAQAVSDSNDAQLSTLLAPLFDENSKFNMNALDELTSSDIIAKIDNASKIASENITAETIIPAVTEAVEAVKTVVSDDYLSRLEDTFTNIKALLSKIRAETAKTKVISLLDVTEDSQVDSIIEQLNSVIEERNVLVDDRNKLVDTKNFENWTTYSCAALIKAAIVATWPTQINTRLSNCLASIETEFSAALSDSLSNFGGHKETLNSILNETSVMLGLLNAEAIKALFGRIKSLLSISTQKDADIELIQEVSALVPDSKDLTNALDAENTNHILSTIITDLCSTTNVKQKQVLQASLKEALNKAIHIDEQLLSVLDSLLWPNIAKLEAELDDSEAFYKKLLVDSEQTNTEDEFISAITSTKNYILAYNAENGFTGDISIPDDSCYFNLISTSIADFEQALKDFESPDASLLPDDVIRLVNDVLKNEVLIILSDIADDLAVLNSKQLAALSGDAILEIQAELKNTDIKACITALGNEVKLLDQKDVIDAGYEKAFRTLRIEEQLLEEIRAIDTAREFYYSAPIEDHFAIELNESDKSLNTLMNPLTNYDINNVNNSFVISKLDIDYLDNGIKIARSSRLS
jgi:hypothetical protein